MFLSRQWTISFHTYQIRSFKILLEKLYQIPYSFIAGNQRKRNRETEEILLFFQDVEWFQSIASFIAYLETFFKSIKFKLCLARGKRRYFTPSKILNNSLMVYIHTSFSHSALAIFNNLILKYFPVFLIVTLTLVIESSLCLSLLFRVERFCKVLCDFLKL